MKSYWEMQYYEQIDEENRPLVSRIYYDDFADALRAFNTLVRQHVEGIIIYAHIAGYPISPVLAFNNDWDSDFIKNPLWIE